MDTLGDRLRALRGEAELTLRTLGDAIGLSPAILSAYENNDKMPSLENAISIASFFGVTLDWLCARRDTPFKRNYPRTKGDAIRAIMYLTNSGEFYPCPELGKGTRASLQPSHLDENLLKFAFSNSQTWSEKFLLDLDKLMLAKLPDNLSTDMLSAWVQACLKKYDKEPCACVTIGSLDPSPQPPVEIYRKGKGHVQHKAGDTHADESEE